MRDNRDNKTPKDDIKDKLVAINRVTKVVKGGRRFGFAALVVAGDESGRVGFGHGKAKEVPEAIKKANDSARKSMIKIPLREGRTLHHDIVGNHGASKVVMRSAPSGTGIIAGGSVRAVFELLGIKDIVTKSIGSANPYNIIRAAVNGLKQQKSPKMVAARRSKKVAEINSVVQKIIGTLKGLGLKKMQSTSILVETPEVLGMIKKVQHLVKTERV